MGSLFLKLLGGDPLRIAVAAIMLAAIGLAASRVSVWRSAYVELAAVEEARDIAIARLEAERGCLAGTDCSARLERNAAARRAAVEAATRAAQERAREEREAREAEARAAVQRATEAASEARVRAAAWEARYRAASSAEGACRTWAEGRVPCPVE